MNVGMMKPPFGDLGHAAAAKHKTKKRAGTNTETISIPVGLCMASSRIFWCSMADRLIRLEWKDGPTRVAALSQELNLSLSFP
jgi:hypothetical protein